VATKATFSHIFNNVVRRHSSKPDALTLLHGKNQNISPGNEEREPHSHPTFHADDAATTTEGGVGSAVAVAAGEGEADGGVAVAGADFSVP